MAQISSINFKKSNPIQIQHNDRDLPPNYLIGGAVECNRNHQEALVLKNKIVKEAIENYTKRTGQKSQAKSYEWSAVVNIKPDTSMNDLENLANHFQEKYGFQCYQIAIHRDEGHISDNGEKIINHHAHLEFITLDKETGKNNYRRELITPKILREIQSEVAEILQMQRGQDKRISGTKRIEPRAYASLKEKEKKAKKQELLTKNQYKEAIENFRKQQAGKGLNKEFFRDLSNLKKNFEAINEEDLSKLLNDILERHLQIEKENQTMKEIIGKARCSEDGELGMLVEGHIRQGKSEFVVNEIKQNITYYALKDANVKGLQQEIEKLKKENLELKQGIEKRDNFINNLGKMLNFQGLSYATPINELERYLKPKEQKNDDLYQKENKNDLKANSDILNNIELIEQKLQGKKEKLRELILAIPKDQENDLKLVNKIIDISDDNERFKALKENNFEKIFTKYADKLMSDWKEYEDHFNVTSTSDIMLFRNANYHIQRNNDDEIKTCLKELKKYLDFLNKSEKQSEISNDIETLQSKLNILEIEQAQNEIQEIKQERAKDFRSKFQEFSEKTKNNTNTRGYGYGR
ncbi:hypothetical protein [Campylobacter sp. 2457A]|uniref:hypothetical protein n=1 Tax=Campylobacter sp. 2457A TaxID=2735784 RepID=UPI00301C895D